MAIIPAGFGQFNIKFTGIAVPNGAEITCGFEIGTILANDPVVYANAIADAFSPTVMTGQSNLLTFTECYVKFGPNETGPSGSAFRTVVGSGTTTPVPPNFAVLIRKTTSSGGRRGRGRMYLPGVAEADIGPTGEVGPAMHTLQSNNWLAFYNGLTTDGIEPVVLHSAGISATPAPTPILAFDVQTLGATQRDRMRR